MPKLSAKERVARLAGGQCGRITRGQLAWLGISDATIADWLRQGYLHQVLPRVYAVGHTAKTTESDLMTAVLYAGPGAMLSHATAAWWVGLADWRPYMIDVSTPRRCRSLPGIRVHGRRVLDRSLHNGLPVTPFPQTMIDYASAASLTKVRRALAIADFKGGLNVAAVEAELRSGRAGGKRLRRALANYQPALARTKSGLELALFELCEDNHLPLPEINARIAGWEVDALWREQRLVVEVDGPGNHRTPAQIRRDRRKELDLRTAAVTVLRYSDEQVDRHRPAIAQELRQHLTPPAPPI
jgi:very-short-patch-repair endonuclease